MDSTDLLTEINNIVAEINSTLKDDSELKEGLKMSLINLGIDVDENVELGDLITIVGGLRLSGGDATINDVVSGKTFTNADSTAIQTGVLPIASSEAKIVTPTASQQTLPAGFYEQDITINGNSNLVAGNIKRGVTIFGVKGTYDSIVTKTFNQGYTCSFESAAEAGGAGTVFPLWLRAQPVTFKPSKIVVTIGTVRFYDYYNSATFASYSNQTINSSSYTNYTIDVSSKGNYDSAYIGLKAVVGSSYTSNGYEYYADLYASASGDYCDRWNQMQVTLSNITVKYYK